MPVHLAQTPAIWTSALSPRALSCVTALLHAGAGVQASAIHTDYTASARGAITHPARRFLAELEVKVQLAAEDLQQGLYDNSTTLTSKVVLMSSELVRTREDVLALAATVGSLASQVAADERSCSVAASRLRKLDTVKQRVLGAKTTLEVRVDDALAPRGTLSARRTR